MFWHFYIGFIKCAPTLPFLVGTYRHIFVNEDFSIVDLIDEISRTEVSEREEITIRFCSLIEEYVLVRSGALGYSSTSPLPLLNDRFVGYEGSARHLASDYDEVLNFFVHTYVSNLCKAEYSTDNSKEGWRGFNETEIRGIESAAVAFRSEYHEKAKQNPD